VWSCRYLTMNVDSDLLPKQTRLRSHVLSANGFFRSALKLIAAVCLFSFRFVGYFCFG